MTDLGITNFPGEVAALAAASVWAIASVIYSRLGQQISPLVLNWLKGVIAIGFLLLTLVWQGAGFPAVSWQTVGLLFLSGAIGIALGDTFYFESLNDLGARKALLLEAIAPVLTALLAAIFLQEQLQLWSWLGIGLTIAGVAWVVSERVPDTADPEAVLKPSRLKRGIGFGLLAAIGQSGGALFSRAALVGSDISPLWSSLVRIVAGVVFLMLWAKVQRSPAADISMASLRFGARWRGVLGAVTIAAFLGTYLGIWLQQTAYKFAPAGIAQTLCSTSPLFVLPIALALGETVSLRAMLGVAVATIGIAFLFGLGF